MADPSLFDAPSPPPTFDRWAEFFSDHAPIKAQLDSPESVDAAVANMPNRGTQRERILSHLQEWGPATDEQLQDALGMEGSTERPRRVELVDAGLVERVGTARTKSGRAAALWGAR